MMPPRDPSTARRVRAGFAQDDTTSAVRSPDSWDRESFLRHRSYIDNNPVKAGLADKPENYPYGSAYFRNKKKAAGPKGHL